MTRCLFLMTVLLSCAWSVQQPATIDLRVEQKPLLVLVERIARQCDAGLVVHRAARPLLDVPVTIDARDVPWVQGMDLLRDQYRIELSFIDGRLEVANADFAGAGRLEVRYHDIRGLSVEVDLPAPRLGLPQNTAGALAIAPPMAREHEAGTVRASTLEGLIRDIAPATWKTFEQAKIEEIDGILKITQLPEVHERIAALLTGLRRQMARQVVCRCYRLPKVPDGAATVINTDVWKRLGEGLQPAACWVLADGNRNHHASGLQRSIILDADVNQARYMPIVSTVASGLAVDLRAHVLGDGVLAEIGVQAAVEPTVVAELLTDAAGKRFYELDMASLTVDRQRDLRRIPAGGAAIYRFGDRAIAITCERVDATLK